MRTAYRIIIIFMSITTCAFLYRLTFKMDCFPCLPLHFRKPPSIDDVLSPGTGIIFLETSDSLEPRPLVSCAVESATRIYPDRPVVFLMKGLVNHTKEEINSTHKAFTLLSSIGNVFMFPLNMEKLLKDTPLLPWYVKVNHTSEKYWTHISADANRLAIIWKYGGIYMDTDFISLRRIPVDDFLAVEHTISCSNGIFSFKSHHLFILDCMESFVENYNGNIWGQQGPVVFSRIMNKRCRPPLFQEEEDGMCQNISILNPQRFYPIGYPSWKRYYDVWKINPTFNDSYALHLWNYMNREKKSVIPGSNTLVEHLYKTYCPTTYKVLINSTEEE